MSTTCLARNLIASAGLYNGSLVAKLPPTRLQKNAMRFISTFAFVVLFVCLGFPKVADAQPPWGGGDRGGSPFGGGGDRGGDQGGDRGGGGGFDPSGFLDRLDQNKNGMLDPDEMQGPAQFMVSRLQRDDPSIRADKPIPLKKFREAFDKMRGGGDRWGGGGGESSDEARKATEQKISEAMIATPLVPGFGSPEEDLMREPLLGFGPAAEMMAVEVTAKDQQDAEENLRRSDRNSDGVLSGDELSSRWSGNPMDFDRNGDKKLSLNELAIRTARKRIVESSPEVRAVAGKSARDKRPAENKAEEPKDLYNGRKSYLVKSPKLSEGLPGWFAAQDRNGDQQVEMNEYTDTWSDAAISEFNLFDRNADGVVTAKECLAAVESGASASTVSSTSMTATLPSLSSAESAPAQGMAASSGVSKLPATPDTKLTEVAKKIVTRYDKNGDGALTASEWETMLVDPKPADGDKDGRITIPEYAAWMAAKSAR